MILTRAEFEEMFEVDVVDMLIFMRNSKDPYLRIGNTSYYVNDYDDNAVHLCAVRNANDLLNYYGCLIK